MTAANNGDGTELDGTQVGGTRLGVRGLWVELRHRRRRASGEAQMPDDAEHTTEQSPEHAPEHAPVVPPTPEGIAAPVGDEDGDATPLAIPVP